MNVSESRVTWCSRFVNTSQMDARLNCKLMEIVDCFQYQCRHIHSLCIFLQEDLHYKS